MGIDSRGYLYVSTTEDGVYRSIKSTTGIVELFTPKKFSLDQNFPDPFNPSTKIKYEIAEKCFITLRVYDLLGKEIITLVNEEKPAGSYIIDFNIHKISDSISSGVYIYRMTAGKYINSRKMILTK